MVRSGVLALGALAFVQGCVQSNDVPAPKASSIRFAVEADTSLAGVRVATTRTIAHQMNVAEPLFVGFEDGHAVVTYAQRQLEGASLTLESDSLAPLARADRHYASHAQPQAYLSGARASVTLRDGRTLNLWTDDETGHVLADVDGSIPATLWAGDAVGAPHAASVDGQHVVVAFATSTENGFDLVAIALEAR